MHTSSFKQHNTEQLLLPTHQAVGQELKEATSCI